MGGQLICPITSAFMRSRLGIAPASNGISLVEEPLCLWGPFPTTSLHRAVARRFSSEDCHLHVPIAGLNARLQVCKIKIPV